MVLSEGAKQRLSIVINLTKTAFHYGFLPAVLYLGTIYKKMNNTTFNRHTICYILGFKKGADPGMPEITVGK